MDDKYQKVQMIFLTILNDFCKEFKIFIDFSLDKIEYYDSNNVKQINEIVSECYFRNRTSIMGMRMVLDHYSKNEIIFAVIQKIGIRNQLDSEKKQTEIIQVIKFIIDELRYVLDGKFSLETNDFPGRIIFNMISDMILSKKLMNSHFNPEMYMKGIFNACINNDLL
jgi:hypothetical protein